MTTEVYSCKPGQKLKEGKLDYAHDIDTKEQAEADAKRRCMRDPSLAKVAYYTVDESGRFRILFTYTNPNVGQPKPKAAAVEPKRRSPVRRKPAPKPGLVARLLRSLGLKGRR